MLGHVLNVVAVLDESVSHNTLVERCLESFCENCRVFLVENDKYSVETTLFLSVFPETIISLGFRTESCDSNFTPVAKLVLVTPETLSSNTLFS
jgi:hypothetical protein